MLEKINSSFKKWWFKFFIFLFSIIFLLLFYRSNINLSIKGRDDIIARVGNYRITSSDLDEEFDRQLSLRDFKGGKQPEKWFEIPLFSISLLREVIANYLLRSEVISLGFVKNDKLDRILLRKGSRNQSLENETLGGFNWNKSKKVFTDSILSWVRIPNIISDLSLGLDLKNNQIVVISINLPTKIGHGHFSEQDLRNFYIKNEALLRIPEGRDITAILINHDEEKMFNSNNDGKIVTISSKINDEIGKGKTLREVALKYSLKIIHYNCVDSRCKEQRPGRLLVNEIRCDLITDLDEIIAWRASFQEKWSVGNLEMIGANFYFSARVDHVYYSHKSSFETARKKIIEILFENEKEDNMINLLRVILQRVESGSSLPFSRLPSTCYRVKLDHKVINFSNFSELSNNFPSGLDYSIFLRVFKTLKIGQGLLTWYYDKIPEKLNRQSKALLVFMTKMTVNRSGFDKKEIDNLISNKKEEGVKAELSDNLGQDITECFLHDLKNRFPITTRGSAIRNLSMSLKEN